ncbi:hypothetical protein HYFRA_00004866 [Hymenoscyphus fraxineus]|uniref:Uncharacterized protein n=1 Tax=Hymenoscyphus fraxineus TaxID=746836 RepID=A0A9N9KLM0_9HELO|nr:hypothetical protein HYFRA_00004866 [Hymenoscyphus fraxineus]
MYMAESLCGKMEVLRDLDIHESAEAFAYRKTLISLERNYSRAHMEKCWTSDSTKLIPQKTSTAFTRSNTVAVSKWTRIRANLVGMFRKKGCAVRELSTSEDEFKLQGDFCIPATWQKRQFLRMMAHNMSRKLRDNQCLDPPLRPPHSSRVDPYQKNAITRFLMDGGSDQPRIDFDHPNRHVHGR